MKLTIALNESSFERAAVLFNCGALMSAIAANQGLNTDEELKTSAKHFQQSAGVFLALKDTVLGLVHQVRIDFSTDIRNSHISVEEDVILGSNA